MQYILLLVFLHGYGPRPTTVMQEFNSEKTCESAKNQVRGAYQRDGSERSLITAVCIPK